MPILIRSDGHEWEVDGYLTPQGVQALVGGAYDHLPLSDGRHLFVHQRDPAQTNVRATDLFSAKTRTAFSGDVLVFTEAEYARYRGERGVRWLTDHRRKG